MRQARWRCQPKALAGPIQPDIESAWFGVFVIEPAFQVLGAAMARPQHSHDSFQQLIQSVVQVISPVGGIFEGAADLHLGPETARHDGLDQPAQGLIEALDHQAAKTARQTGAQREAHRAHSPPTGSFPRR